MGNTEKAKKVLEEQFKGPKPAHIWPTWTALIYLALGEIDKTFEWFERAYEARDHGLVYLRSMQLIDDIRPDPMWQALMKKMGLEPSVFSRPPQGE